MNIASTFRAPDAKEVFQDSHFLTSNFLPPLLICDKARGRVCEYICGFVYVCARVCLNVCMCVLRNPSQILFPRRQTPSSGPGSHSTWWRSQASLRPKLFPLNIRNFLNYLTSVNINFSLEEDKNKGVT